MHRLTRALGALLLLWVAPGANAETAREAALRDIRAMIEAAPGEAGLVVAVTDREQVLLVAAHGYADIAAKRPVTAETHFAIGSISKSFTALTLMQMADEGRFDPAAPIARYLPDFHPRSPYPAITGHALLTHTAGLPNYITNVASMRFLIAALNDIEPGYAPGAHFWYSNSGYQLLGYAAERIDKLPFPLILQHRTLDRLGMTETTPQIDDRLRATLPVSYTRQADGRLVAAPWFSYLAADGAITSTAADMSRYARMLLNRGALPNGRLVSAKAFERFATPVLDGYGYGMNIAHDGRVLSHSGGIAGFQSYLEMHPTENFALVFLSNGPLDGALLGRIVARLSRDTPTLPKTTPPAAPSSFAGRFVARDGAALTFAATDDGGLRTGDQPLTRLANDLWGAYLTPHGPRTFQFRRDAAGVVTGVSEGASDYAREGSPASAAAPAGYRAFVGRYATHGEEGPGVRVFVQQGQLMISYADTNARPTPLAAIDETHFRFADPAFAPERLAFDTIIDGQAQRLTMSGVPLYRINLP